MYRSMYMTRTRRSNLRDEERGGPDGEDGDPDLRNATTGQSAGPIHQKEKEKKSRIHIVDRWGLGTSDSHKSFFYPVARIRQDNVS